MSAALKCLKVLINSPCPSGLEQLSNAKTEQFSDVKSKLFSQPQKSLFLEEHTYVYISRGKIKLTNQILCVTKFIFLQLLYLFSPLVGQCPMVICFTEYILYSTHLCWWMLQMDERVYVWWSINNTGRYFIRWLKETQISRNLRVKLLFSHFVFNRSGLWQNWFKWILWCRNTETLGLAYRPTCTKKREEFKFHLCSCITLIYLKPNHKCLDKSLFSFSASGLLLGTSSPQEHLLFERKKQEFVQILAISFPQVGRGVRIGLVVYHRLECTNLLSRPYFLHKSKYIFSKSWIIF